MIKVMVGGSAGLETKAYGTLSDFRFALSMMKRDNRFQFIFASTDRGLFYGAVKGPAGRAAVAKWQQTDKARRLGLLNGDDTRHCFICKIRVIPIMGKYCPLCDCNLTSG